MVPWLKCTSKAASADTGNEAVTGPSQEIKFARPFSVINEEGQRRYQIPVARPTESDTAKVFLTQEVHRGALPKPGSKRSMGKTKPHPETLAIVQRPEGCSPFHFDEHFGHNQSLLLTTY